MAITRHEANYAHYTLVEYADYSTALSEMRAAVERIHSAAACTDGHETRAVVEQHLQQLAAAAKGLELMLRKQPQYAQRPQMLALFQYAAELAELGTLYASAQERQQAQQATLRQFIAAHFDDYRRMVDSIDRTAHGRPAGMSEARRMVAEDLNQRAGTYEQRLAALQASLGTLHKGGIWMSRANLSINERLMFDVVKKVRADRARKWVDELLRAYSKESAVVRVNVFPDNVIDHT